MHWFNDVWEYDPNTRLWSSQDCMGFIPIAREGHAAALVDDVMYVFGGRTEEGKDLGDLAAYRLTTRRWYSFQNMGPSPSPRSGHTMTASGNKIIVLGGEPSSTPRVDPDELSMAYILDTGKIRYPADDVRGAAGQRHGGSRRPSAERSQSSRDRSTSRERNDQVSQSSFGSQESLQNPTKPRLGVDTSGNGPRMLRGTPSPSLGLPPQHQIPQPPVSKGRADSLDSESRQDGRTTPRMEKTLGTDLADENNRPSTGVVTGQYSHPGTPQRNGMSNDRSPESPVPNSINSRTHRVNSSLDSSSREGTFANDMKSREINTEMQSLNTHSGTGSSPAISQQSKDTSRELESIRSQNSWYAAELALARKAGYRPRRDGAGMQGTLDTIGDDDKPVLDAFFQMKEELGKMQQSLQTQSAHAADRIAQVERQRDTAIAESVYVKARLAATSEKDGGHQLNDHFETSERLSKALAQEKESAAQLRNAVAELEAERVARQLAEESASIALQRATDLDTHKQQTSSELETLRAELHSTQVTARQEASTCMEAVTAHQLLQVERNELQAKHSTVQSQVRDHETIVASLRDAIASSSDKTSLVERKLEYERRQRSGLEEKLAHLTAEHDARVIELESTVRLLQDAEELAESNAAEAKVHREAVLGLTKKNENGDVDHTGQDGRVNALQQRLEAANVLVRKNQNSADAASERLRRAEERIAGLETYQEQTSREGLAMRKQLQNASRDTLYLKTRNAELERQLASEKLDITAMQVQHSALKGLLQERGMDVDTSRSAPVDQEQLRQLEQQVSASLRAHDGMRAFFEDQQKENNKAWEDRLAALDNDYQAAVKYLKGTEKVLSKMKQELHKYKTRNKELEDEVSKRGTNNPDWLQERATLRTHIEGMESRINRTQSQLEQQSRDAQVAHQERDHYRQQVELAQSTMQRLESQNATLNARAAEAERKAQFLLSTVGTTVNNYVRDAPRMNGHVHNRDSTTLGMDGESLGLGQQEVATRNATVMARNSMALDTLANELETLRSHWETTNKNYRYSDNGDDQAQQSKGPGNGEAVLSDSLANWRKNLELEDADEYGGERQHGKTGA